MGKFVFGYKSICRTIFGTQNIHDKTQVEVWGEDGRANEYIINGIKDHRTRPCGIFFFCIVMYDP
jgi:hypothetical protein